MLAPHVILCKHTLDALQLYTFLFCFPDDTALIYSQRAPAFLSMGISSPPRWRDMILLVPPTSFPPMNTTGTGGPLPSSLRSALSISLPLGSWSSSCTSALTPRSQKRRVTVWHMQHELKVKITTARSDASFITRSICVVFLTPS